jgi:hypothetical protein
MEKNTLLRDTTHATVITENGKKRIPRKKPSTLNKSCAYGILPPARLEASLDLLGSGTLFLGHTHWLLKVALVLQMGLELVAPASYDTSDFRGGTFQGWDSDFTIDSL